MHADIDLHESGRFQPRGECVRVDSDHRVAVVEPFHAAAPTAVGACEDPAWLEDTAHL